SCVCLLSLHDALPICVVMLVGGPEQRSEDIKIEQRGLHGRSSRSSSTRAAVTFGDRRGRLATCSPLRSSVTRGRSAPCRTSSLRSEEHTSELQSRGHL